LRFDNIHRPAIKEQGADDMEIIDVIRAQIFRDFFYELPANRDYDSA
jgi:hypothetical protein